ncbi:pre-mRNA-splicing factor ATP-dependent RNA helicase PRP43 [Eremomyces bilateralis CBS 781.70]|uniref:RNA helicase n=1 Tax=Eremomyces bilateralis CBS 781.70 TaxID=1392243 RepID=A0A6G1FZF4_9PEZI|nr:pre-mRNA-splicing factor ATP-dependent RNA helicase PRP43 [Eremomyces bilateralis CBS 781.70]KAF1811056.1 pre-mRNA-splicing factor ATP-dependent RNA helicase PRP43 [Eremomyces bilateralis CBS 781.70]
MPKPTRERKHKRLAKLKDTNNLSESNDSNAVEIIPKSKAEREADKARIRAGLNVQQQGKISGKKKKRLEKYVETKLKRDEVRDLIGKLETLHRERDEVLDGKELWKTGDLGRSTAANAAEWKSREWNPESGSDEEEDSEFDEEDGARKPAKQAPAPLKAVSGFGGGLKRALEVDDGGQPVIKKRKRRKRSPVRRELEEEEGSEWEGFGSGDDAPSADVTTGHDEISVLKEGMNAADQSQDDSESAFSVSEDSDSSDGPAVYAGSKKEKSARSSAFLSWATQQRNQALGFTPTAVDPNDACLPVEHVPKPANFQPRPLEQEPLPADMNTATIAGGSRKAYAVPVSRTPEIQATRIELPVVAEEQKIMEAVHNHDVTIVWGSTGSGKTTQVPQFLFEAGYGDPKGPSPGIIGVTQPRRVATVSMAKRVGEEMGDMKHRVGYKIRFDGTVTANTAIKFMTDGVLLREVSQDFSLAKYSAIIIDEAHERGVNTDILIGMLSRIVNLRKDMAKTDESVKPLKLIIMSATLRTADFAANSRLFRETLPPVVKAEGRQHPVSVHFSRKTKVGYVEEVFKKVKRGHEKLPPGGMLVFLTGQDEIWSVAKQLKQAFPSTSAQGSGAKVAVSAEETPPEDEDIALNTEQSNQWDAESDSDEEITGLDEDEVEDEFDIGEEKEFEKLSKVHVLPLYSQLPTKQQLRVFDSPPPGSRLIILATNVAETSITIPGIRYVFDTGRAKSKKYDRETGIQTFEVGWISKASAAQRAGRAGRTGPGHCYRLFSSAIYEADFKEFQDPEIIDAPLEGVVLQLRSLGLKSIVDFPFPSPPDVKSLLKAERLLSYLGALSTDGAVTVTGRALSAFPLSPRLGRMLYLGKNHKIVALSIALVAALAVPELFIPQSQLNLGDEEHEFDEEDDDRIDELRKSYNASHATLSRWDRTSDAIKLLTALCASAHATDTEAWATSMFLRPKALKEASMLREQLTSIMRTQSPGAIGSYAPRIPQPTDKEIKMLRQIVAAGYIDQVAQRGDLSPHPPELHRRPKRAIDVPYVTLLHSTDSSAGSSNGADANDSSKYVYLHPSSVLARTAAKNLPQYIIYSRLQRSASSVPGKIPKVRMHPLTPVSGVQLTALADGTPLLEYGKPIGNIVGLPAEGGKERRECWVVPSLKGETGGNEWPLPARRVVQRREAGVGWVIEKVVIG